MERFMRPLVLLALYASLDAAVVPTWGVAQSRSMRQGRALSPSRLSLAAIRGGAPSTEGIPILAGAAPIPGDGKVFLKLSINYGVDGGSIVAVGPSSCFGTGDIHKGESQPPYVARVLVLVQPQPDFLFASMFCVRSLESLSCGESLTRRVCACGASAQTAEEGRW